MARSKFQNYETEVISRADIKNAPYNPRFMDEGAKKRLRANIAKHGLVSALTWNRRTGNLVGGHQRLEQLDSLEPSKDYDLTVCVIDVDEREEAALNVQLNNPSMQGEWDLDKLANMAEDFNFDLQGDLGFSDDDIDFLFDGDDRFSDLFESPEKEEGREKLNKVKDAREKGKEMMKEKASAGFYVTVVFHTEADRDEFMKNISVPRYEQYITEEQVARYHRIK